MAGGVRMASQGPPGLWDIKATWEKQAVQEHQVRSFHFSFFSGPVNLRTVYKVSDLSSICLRYQLTRL